MAEFHLMLSAEIGRAQANSFIQYLYQLANQNPDWLTIAMSCPGGNVVEGISMYNAMRAMPYPIVAHNIGNVDSIANVIFLGASQRLACSGSTFMFHGVGFNGNAAERLDENNLRAKLDTVLADHRRISGIFAQRTNGAVSVSAGMKLFKEQRTRSAQWALEKGFATGISDFALPAGANFSFIT